MQNSSPLDKLNRLSNTYGDLTRLYVDSKLSTMALDLIVDRSAKSSHDLEAVKDVVQQILSANPSLTLTGLVDESLQSLQNNVPDDLLEGARCFIACKISGGTNEKCNEDCKTSQI